ncbi:MAG: hypothetical protein ACFFD1_07040 [Candidatus Thorarchaeota archaeon]
MLPLLSLGHKENLIETIESQIWKDKITYQKLVKEEILEKFWIKSWHNYWQEEGIPTPTILVQLTTKSPTLRLVRPDITLSIANETSRYLQNNGGDEAVMSFLDAEFKLDLFFKGMLMELVANTLAPDDGKSVPLESFSWA